MWWGDVGLSRSQPAGSTRKMPIKVPLCAASVEDRILALPSTCSADLAIKVALYDFHQGYVGEKSIVSDARNLAKDAQRAAFTDPRDYLVFLATEYLAAYEQCGPGISDAQTALPLIAKKNAA
jgi:hypothetical protein